MIGLSAVFRRLVLVALVLTCFALLGPSSEQNNALSFQQLELQQLQDRCVQSMFENTCAVMGNAPSSTKIIKPGTLVYIAGVGAMDAIAYQDIYQYGNAMCTTIVKDCVDNWSSAQCLIARKIYLK